MTTITPPTWQRRQHARNTAARRTSNARALAAAGVLLAASGIALVALGAPYAGGIVITVGAMVAAVGTV
jgi:hypothetical protein